MPRGANLISAIKVAAAGNALLAPSVTTRLIDVFARRPPGTLPALASLGRYGMLEMVSLRMKDSACRISP